MTSLFFGLTFVIGGTLAWSIYYPLEPVCTQKCRDTGKPFGRLIGQACSCYCPVLNPPEDNDPCDDSEGPSCQRFCQILGYSGGECVAGGLCWCFCRTRDPYILNPTTSTTEPTEGSNSTTTTVAPHTIAPVVLGGGGGDGLGIDIGQDDVVPDGSATAPDAESQGVSDASQPTATTGIGGNNPSPGSATGETVTNPVAGGQPVTTGSDPGATAAAPVPGNEAATGQPSSLSSAPEASSQTATANPLLLSFNSDNGTNTSIFLCPPTPATLKPNPGCPSTTTPLEEIHTVQPFASAAAVDVPLPNGPTKPRPKPLLLPHRPGANKPNPKPIRPILANFAWNISSSTDKPGVQSHTLSWSWNRLGQLRPSILLRKLETALGNMVLKLFPKKGT